MTDWGGVLEESIVLDGEVVGGERFAQTLTALKQFLQKTYFCWSFSGKWQRTQIHRFRKKLWLIGSTLACGARGPCFKSMWELIFVSSYHLGLGHIHLFIHSVHKHKHNHKG